MRTRDEYLRDSVPQQYRGHYRKAYEAKSPLKAIRAKCLDCMCWQPSEVGQCPIVHCPLWEYRFGHRPTASSPEKMRNPRQCGLLTTNAEEVGHGQGPVEIVGGTAAFEGSGGNPPSGVGPLFPCSPRDVSGF